VVGCCEHGNECNKLNQTKQYAVFNESPHSVYYIKAATSFGLERAISMGSDSLVAALPSI
jgi:hypothetical protein